jgi:hypothetical protein
LKVTLSILYLPNPLTDKISENAPKSTKVTHEIVDSNPNYAKSFKLAVSD